MGRAVGLGLLVVVVVGAGAPYRAGGGSLWLDEACSVEAAVQPLSGIVAYTRGRAPAALLLSASLRIPIAGSSETALRTLSGRVLDARSLRSTAWQRRCSAPTDLVAALLLAVSPFHLATAQEARMYALLGFLSLWSMFELVRLLDPSHARRPVVFAGYVLTTALMLYTHVYGFFVLAAQALFLAGLALWSRPVLAPMWKRILLAQSLAFVLFLPWFQVFLEQLFHVQKNFVPPPGRIARRDRRRLRRRAGIADPDVSVCSPCCSFRTRWSACSPCGSRVSFSCRSPCRFLAPSSSRNTRRRIAAVSDSSGPRDHARAGASACGGRRDRRRGGFRPVRPRLLRR
jgi:hypothetical protein